MPSGTSAVARAIVEQLNTGKAKPAFQAARKAMSRHPKEGGFANLAALALVQMNRHREALPYFQKAMKAAPGNRDYRDNFLRALVSLGEHDRAARLLGKLLDKSPDDADLNYLHAVALMNAGQPKQALTAVDRAIAANPAMTMAHNLRGVLLAEDGRDADALASFETALSIDPDAIEVLVNMAPPLARTHRADHAMAVLERALELAPDHAGALHRYALQLSEIGRTADARAAYHRLLALQPAHAEALAELARFSDPAQIEELTARVTALLKRCPAQSPDYPHLAFARATLTNRSGDANEARRAYHTANKAVARIRPHDRDAAQAEYQRAEQDFPKGSTLAAPAASSPKPVPIFIIGQPRSGTTLTEQILTAHPYVFGLGEHAAAGRILRAHHARSSAFDPDRARQAYLASLPPGARASNALTDKMPANYRYLGYLAQAFAQARFVHTARDPRDVAMSMWRSYFPARALNYTFDMAAMADQANLYRRYMRLWGTLLGDRLMTVDYETMVTDVSATSRLLADHTGLTWMPEMARPDTNRAPVRTASLVQVREPVHARSVGQWRAEATALAPFIDRLDPELWPELGLG